MTLHAMNVASWRPPSVFHHWRETELWNAILSYAGQPLAPNGKGASVQFASIERPMPRTSALLIEPENGPQFAAVITSFPFAKMFGADIDLAEVRTLPAALRDCLEEGVIATLWRAIPEDRMGSFRIIRSGSLDEVARPSDASGWQWLSVTIEGVAPEAVTLAVGLPVALVVAALGGDVLAPDSMTNGLAQLLTTEATHTLGSVMLTVDALARLRPGDMVAMPELPPDQVLIRADWTSYAFRRGEKGWTCLGRQAAERYRPDLDTQGTAMTQAIDKAISSHVDIGELGVVVDFDLGRLTVPLAQVQTWQAGSIVPLDPPAATEGVEVTVRANGQVIGIGDLIRIDERIAVRLTRLVIRS